MSEGPIKKTVHIPEIARIEGHAAVDILIENGEVQDVKLDVFEGTRFFEQIVRGHKFDELPHLTSRVCAICSTGHVIAAARAIENIFGFQPGATLELLRELMHLGMIIESHATHVYALAVPDFLGIEDLVHFATKHPDLFAAWTQLRNLGSTIQTVVGGRPFHPVNLHVGGLSKYPDSKALTSFLPQITQGRTLAQELCGFLLQQTPPPSRTTNPEYLALVPQRGSYSFFGDVIRSSEGWDADVQNYKEYLQERSVPHSHAKQSRASSAPLMVGAMARLHLFGELLTGSAREIWMQSRLYQGDPNTILNNLAQAIEIVFALDRVEQIVSTLLSNGYAADQFGLEPYSVRGGAAAGAVECPRGTLYHYYELDSCGTILQADMVTPSAQNTRGIEIDIKEVVRQLVGDSEAIQSTLETLVRAYDPCNTCATHMVSVRYC